jgi:hypothetical protein
MGAATTGNGWTVTSTGAYTAASGNALVNVVANSATTAGGLLQISGTALTFGTALLITGGGANITSTGIVESINMGAATTGIGLKIATTGVYAGTTGILTLTANSATTGTIAVINSTALTTGVSLQVNATAATLTTGFYFAANDATGNVLTIGGNGHITSNLGGASAPTIAVGTQDGITAAAITAGSTDVCGTITTTGTSTGGTIMTVTFNQTYTTAPKVVIITPANANAAAPNTMPYVSSITATTFVITIPGSGTYAATPSYKYLVIA